MARLKRVAANQARAQGGDQLKLFVTTDAANSARNALSDPKSLEAALRLLVQVKVWGASTTQPCPTLTHKP